MSKRLSIGSLFKLAAFAVCLSLAGAAHAEPPGSDAVPLHVLAVKTGDALDAAEALTKALRSAVRDSKGWSLGGSNQALEFLAEQMKCGSPIDAACEARIADIIKADRYLWCEIDFADKKQQTIKGTLNLFVRGKGTNKAPLSYAANLTDGNDSMLVDIASKAVNAVTEGAPKGRLAVSTGGVAGQLFIDGKPIGAMDAKGTSLRLPAGSHKVEVRSKGYASSSATVVVKALKDVELKLKLLQVDEGKPVDMRAVGGFVSLGIGVAAGVVGLVAALEVNGIKGDERWELYRKGVTKGSDVCGFARNGLASNVAGAFSTEEAVAACDAGDRAELMELVAFPLAGVGAGLGLYLIGTSSLVSSDSKKDDKQSAFQLLPIVTPTMQAIHASYRF
jgi:hypothetical protein